VTTGPAAQPPRRRGRPPTGVRESVLAATEAILAEAGVARLSTKEVASRAAVAESSIFYHFRDRLGLLRAVVEAQLPPLHRLLTELHEGGGQGSLRADLVALLDTLEAFYLRTMPVAAAIQSDGQLRLAFAQQHRDLDVGPHRALQAVHVYLDEQRRRGRLSGHGDLRAAALLLVGAAHQRALQRQFGTPATLAHVPSTGDAVDLLLPLLAAAPDQDGPPRADRV
jgi:AcrR family transcriptional regulator